LSRGGCFSGLAASASAVALATAVIGLLQPHALVLSVGALYVFVVLPAAIGVGLPYALAVVVASILAFEFFFPPPLHSFAIADQSSWFALGVYVVTAAGSGGRVARPGRDLGVRHARIELGTEHRWTEVRWNRSCPSVTARSAGSCSKVGGNARVGREAVCSLRSRRCSLL
jgi:hypothetical protein